MGSGHLSHIHYATENARYLYKVIDCMEFEDFLLQYSAVIENCIKYLNKTILSHVLQNP